MMPRPGQKPTNVHCQLCILWRSSLRSVRAGHWTRRQFLCKMPLQKLLLVPRNHVGEGPSKWAVLCSSTWVPGARATQTKSSQTKSLLQSGKHYRQKLRDGGNPSTKLVCTSGVTSAEWLLLRKSHLRSSQQLGVWAMTHGHWSQSFCRLFCQTSVASRQGCKPYNKMFKEMLSKRI